jgi:hypothetical protein
MMGELMWGLTTEVTEWGVERGVLFDEKMLGGRDDDPFV